MADPWRISIRSKILILLSTVVVAAVCFYLFLASWIFNEDKTLLIYELNQTHVRTLGVDVETSFNRILDKLRMLGAAAEGTEQGIGQNSLIELFSHSGEQSEFVQLGMLTRSMEDGERAQIFGTWPKFLELYSKGEDYLAELQKAEPIPFDEVLRKGVWIRNLTRAGDEQPPLFLIAEAEKSRSGTERIVYAYVKLDSLLERFSGSGIAQAYLIDSRGSILAHSRHDLVPGAPDASSDPLVRAAFGSKVRSEVRKFEDGRKTYLGSFYRLPLGNLVIASKVDADEAFAAARILIRKSFLYALIVITGAFLVALFFSHSLTAPIQRLVDATQMLAQGNFGVVVPVSTRDELSTLASSFNRMTRDLRESRTKIEEYSRELERKVEERTARLEAQHIAIQEAQEALVKTTRMASVGEVAGRAAHEVLNPLTNIIARLEKIQSQRQPQEKDDLGLAREITQAWEKLFRDSGATGLAQALAAPSRTMGGKTLLEEDLANLTGIVTDSISRHESRRADVDFLLKECARISRIVNGMRHLTRVSESRRPVDVHALVRETLTTMGDLFSKASIQTQAHLGGPACLVLGDHDALLQVLTNLLRNSMQALQDAPREGGPPPRIWVTVGKLPAGKISIRVSDNGPGIRQENAAKVFEPTFTTKGIADGTGLGLAICRRLVRAHDGEVVLEKSEPGVETAFLIELPELQAEAASKSASKPKSSAGGRQRA